MIESAIATVRPVSAEDATGTVAAIYGDIKATKRLEAVPNFWRVLATNPAHLKMVWTLQGLVEHPHHLASWCQTSWATGKCPMRHYAIWLECMA